MTTQRTGARRRPAGNSTAATAIQPAMSHDTNGKLWKHVEELATSSALLIFLSSVASDKLTLPQAAFFVAAATADAAGKAATRTELLDGALGGSRGSIRNSYRQLLEESRAYPNALGWLTVETNPMDDREKLLKLTPEGRKVVDGILLTLEPMLSPSKKGDAKRRTQ